MNPEQHQASPGRSPNEAAMCMRTRSKSYPINSNATITRRSNRKRVPNIVEPEICTIEEIVPMVGRTMEELLQDSLNAATGGNLLSKPTRKALKIIENKSKVRYSRRKSNASRVYTNYRDSASKTDDRIDKLADQISNLVEIVNKQFITPATAKAVEKTCVICGGEMKAVTTRSGLAYEVPSIPTNSPLENVVEQVTEEITDKEHSNCQGSTAHIQPPKLREKATNQMEKFFQIFHNFHFDISFANAFLLMPKFASTIKSLLTNKDKLFELAKDSLNENCSAMLLKKLPEKLRDPELTPTRMTLELADMSITHPKGVAEDVFVKVGKFHFPTDFVVVDFEADPRVPLILGRSFLRTARALIDVYGEQITLRYNPKSSNPTLVSNPSISESESCKEPIVTSSSPTLTPFGESLSQVDARLVEFKTQEIKFCEKIKGLEFDVESKNNKIKHLMNELENVKKEKDGLNSKLTGFEYAYKYLDTLLGSQRTDKNKEGLVYSDVPPSCSSLLSSQERYILDWIA
nr:hypothetical protein [Tanacetum cinerariifolium]